MSLTRPASPKAPATEPALGDLAVEGAGLLLCCHGVYGGPGAAVQHAGAIQRLGLFAETRVCCLKGRPVLADVVQRMQCPRIFLVPLLMAEGYAAGRLLGGAVTDLAEGHERIVLCRPVGTHPRIAAVLSANALRCCRANAWAPQDTTVIVMGHGTKRCANSGGTAWRHAQALAQSKDFARVESAFLDQPPRLATVLARVCTPHTVVVGLFADRGAHGESDVPRLLAETGYSAAYAGPVGTAPELSRLILDQVLTRQDEAA